MRKGGSQFAVLLYIGEGRGRVSHLASALSLSLSFSQLLKGCPLSNFRISLQSRTVNKPAERAGADAGCDRQLFNAFDRVLSWVCSPFINKVRKSRMLTCLLQCDYGGSFIRQMTALGQMLLNASMAQEIYNMSDCLMYFRCQV
jgi:hypothetical protein